MFNPLSHACFENSTLPICLPMPLFMASLYVSSSWDFSKVDQYTYCMWLINYSNLPYIKWQFRWEREVLDGKTLEGSSLKEQDTHFNIVKQIKVDEENTKFVTS